MRVLPWTTEEGDPQRLGFSRIRDEDRYTGRVHPPDDDRVTDALIRRVWELLATTDQLQQMLLGVAEIVSASLDLQGLGAVAFEEGSGYRFLADWNAEITPEPGETADAFQQRVARTTIVNLPARERRPYDQAVFDQIPAGQPVTCADLLAQPVWYEYEFALAAGGMLAYASIPAFLGDTLVGLTVFCRRRPGGFSETELRVLTDLARPLAVAIARAPANASRSPRSGRGLPTRTVPRSCRWDTRRCSARSSEDRSPCAARWRPSSKSQPPMPRC